ncbi:MAG: RAMP superfamily CRISPR-associated protein [candidate division WOR-3 bacterium]
METMIETRKLNIVLKTLEPFRIGGIEDVTSGRDNPIARIGGRLVIPGTSLKGALRAEIENYLIMKYWKNNKWLEEMRAFQPCIPSSKKLLTPGEKNLQEIGKYRKFACHYPCFEDPCGEENKSEDTKDDQKINEKEMHTICPVCYFLGAMKLIGFVRVPFLYSTVRYEKLYSSRLDRLTGNVVKKTNRPYQLVPKDTEFSGEMEIIIENRKLGWILGQPRPLPNTLGDKWLEGNTKTQDELIKEFIIDRLQAITMLGGYKSKGFGRVEIKVKDNS